MTDPIYLVDNNVLSRLSRHQRASRFLRERCIITEDVLYEARGFTDEITGIRVQPTTVAVLDCLRHVMTQLPSEDTSLVSLYDNKGSADPVLVATALVMMAEQEEMLFQNRVVVVSEDKAVAELAGRLGVEHLSHRAFAALVSDQPGI